MDAGDSRWVRTKAWEEWCVLDDADAAAGSFHRYFALSRRILSFIEIYRLIIFDVFYEILVYARRLRFSFFSLLVD